MPRNHCLSRFGNGLDLSESVILVRALTLSLSLNKASNATIGLPLQGLIPLQALTFAISAHHKLFLDLLTTCSMGLLDQLWDDTVAGPRPEIGLGKLRKNQTFSFRSSSAKGLDGGSARSYGEGSKVEETKVTRSIMIVKPPGYGSGSSDSPPISPAGSTPPVSPFSGGRESFRFRRKSASDAYEKASGVIGERSPRSSYDV